MQREALCQRARQRHHPCTATSAGSAACPVLPNCQSRSLTHIASAKTRLASSGKSHASARVKVNYRVGGDDADAGALSPKPAAAPAPPAAVSAPSQPRPATAARLPTTPTPSALQGTTSAKASNKANRTASLSPLGGTVSVSSAAAAAPLKTPKTSSSKAAAPPAPPVLSLAAPSQPIGPSNGAPVPAAQAPSSPAPAPPPPQPRAQLKVIGLGLRGISAVHRLIDSGTLAEAEFWAIDSDKRVLSSADEAVRQLEVAPGDDASLSVEELAEVAGGAASPAAPGAPDGTAGAVFVLGSAFGSPGGAPMLLQLVRHLRRQGYFVAAALTRPFEFEGSRRLEAADALITTLEEVAHLVVVISQGVLTRASAELTMPQAEAIADNTLVYTVQSTMWALRAPEILKVSNGAFLWYGRDLRAIRRPLFPPMMSLLSCPGHATLGRGQAALPLPLLQQAGLASALSTLAEDAVRAASESPFLDNRLEAATGVLCVLRVPPSILGVAPATQGAAAATGTAGGGGSGGALVTDNHKEYALRSAVQVAAMTVRELVGPHCHDIIVCPQLSAEVEEAAHDGEGGDEAAGRSAGGRLVRVEVSLLALEAIEEAAGGMKVAGKAGLPPALSRSPSPSPSAGPGSGPLLPRSPSPAAAMARERTAILVSTSARANSAQRRGLRMGGVMGGQGARGVAMAGPGLGGAPSIFSGQQPAAAAPQQQPGSSGAPAVQGPVAATRPGNAGAAAAGGTQAAAPGGAAADAAAVAAANSAKKLSRLAAMSALAGGSAAAVHYNLGSTAQYGATARTGPAPAPLGAPTAPLPPPAAQPQPPAGGWSPSARSPLGAPAPPPPPPVQQPQASPVAAPQPMLPAAPTPPPPPQQQAGPMHAAQYGVQQQPVPLPVPQQQQAMPSPYASVPQKGAWGRQQVPSAAPAAAAPGASPTAAATGGATTQAPAGAHSAPGADSSVQQIPRLSENMVTSLVAQSLDLPPQAARWRHRHRAPPPSMNGPRPSVFQLPKVEEERVESDGAGQPAEGAGLGRGLHQLMAGMGLPLPAAGPPPVSSRTLVRSRTVGMLEQERIEEEIELEIQAGLLPGPGAVEAGVAGAGPDA